MNGNQALLPLLAVSGFAQQIGNGAQEAQEKNTRGTSCFSRGAAEDSFAQTPSGAGASFPTIRRDFTLVNAWSPQYLDELCGFAIFEFREKAAAPLPREIHDIPDRVQFVDPALVDIMSQPWMPGIEVAERAVAVSSED